MIKKKKHLYTAGSSHVFFHVQPCDGQIQQMSDPDQIQLVTTIVQ